MGLNGFACANSLISSVIIALTTLSFETVTDQRFVGIGQNPRRGPLEVPARGSKVRHNNRVPATRCIARHRSLSASDAPGESPSRAASTTLYCVVANHCARPESGSKAGWGMRPFGSGINSLCRDGRSEALRPSPSAAWLLLRPHGHASRPRGLSFPVPELRRRHGGLRRGLER
jgi:hypothetical protein